MSEVKEDKDSPNKDNNVDDGSKEESHTDGKFCAAVSEILKNFIACG